MPKTTKKFKIENYDALAAQLEKVNLAVFDLHGKSRFPFRHACYVDCDNEIGEGCDGFKIRITVSMRAMPVYMVISMPSGLDTPFRTLHRQAGSAIDFWTEQEIHDHFGSVSVYWSAVKIGFWKVSRAIEAERGK